MSKSKIIALTALIAFAFAIVGLSNAMAGEKIQIQCRAAKYITKVAPIQLGEQGRVVLVYELMRIHFNLQGKPFCNGWSHREIGFWDTALPEGHGYEEIIDKDGNKIYMTFEVKRLRKDGASGDWTFFKGTGKFEGITGKGTWTSYDVSPNQNYADWEGEVELP